MQPKLSYGLKKPFIWGFIFGALGLYILAVLALILPAAETLGDLLFFPGRYLAEQFAGAEGSNTEVALLSIFNGVLYGVIFTILTLLMRSGKE